MSGAAATMDDNEAISRINGVLRGPVTEVLQDLVPELRMTTRRDAYERIMNNPPLAAQCFHQFRTKPDRFRFLLTAEDSVPVESDEQVLSCGRTLAQVIALVVRAVAKRHFRHRLGFIPKTAAKPKKLGLFQVVFGGFNPPPPPPKRKEYSRADALYQAMRAFLLFEWQVGLIPHYVHLPIALVRDLGPRLLEFRDADAIKTLVRSGQVPPAPAVAPAPASVRSEAGRLPFVAPKLKIDALWTFSLRYGLPAAFGSDDRAMRRLVGVVQDAGGPILTALAQAGLHPPEAAVTAICVVHRLGGERFERLMHSDRSVLFLREFARGAKERDIRSMGNGEDIRKTVNVILSETMPHIGRT
jgi:hypothetical protein